MPDTFLRVKLYRDYSNLKPFTDRPQLYASVYFTKIFTQFILEKNNNSKPQINPYRAQTIQNCLLPIVGGPVFCISNNPTSHPF